MRSVELWGYTIFEDGRICGLQGKELKYNKEICVSWGINGKKRFVSYARFVYYAFNFRNFNFNDMKMVVRHKNGNDKDCSIDNLIVVNRKTYSQGENNASSKLTNEQVEEIKRLYTNTKDTDEEKNNPHTKISYRKLAEKYGVSHSMIAGIVKGQFRNQENYKL